MAIDWSRLRPLGGSQSLAFEELVTQLARYDPVPQLSSFTRKGAPDAGLECYWTLPGGDEWGWQAKYWLSSPGPTQWKQADESFRTALMKHPRLTRYTLSLPIDRADPRIDRQRWFQDQWEIHTETWQSWAYEAGLDVEIQYWGQSEIVDRLSREEHRGRVFFWFGTEGFTEGWFEDRLKQALIMAGPRYTPDLHVDLPISQVFEGLGKTSEFCATVVAACASLAREYAKSRSREAMAVASAEFERLGRSVEELVSELGGLSTDSAEAFDPKPAVATLQVIEELSWACIDALLETQRQESEKSNRRSERFTHENYLLREVRDRASELLKILDGEQGRAAERSALVMVGPAGIGKTHLLCDVMRSRIDHRLPTVILFAADFTTGEPLKQMVELLGLSCSPDELLGALEAAAQAAGERALILVDGINEGEAKLTWPQKLPRMLAWVARSSWVGLAVTARSSYERVVFPSDLLDSDRVVRVEHRGFSDFEYEATRTFFDYYGIAHPQVPLLVPEFDNPLFLRLFCEGLKNRGLTAIQPGVQGVTSILDFFVSSVNEKLSHPSLVDFDPRSNVVMEAVENLAARMADRRGRSLPRDEAKDIVNALLPPATYEKSLFRHLLSEGILMEDITWLDGKHGVDGVRFSYERFGDHSIVRSLLSPLVGSTDPIASAMEEFDLVALGATEQAHWINKGLLEALAVQVPEHFGIEISELFPDWPRSSAIREAFIDSLIWRSRGAFSESTLGFINEEVLRYSGSYEQFFDALLTVAADEAHPYNAEFLDAHLRRFSLPDRDSWWSVLTFKEYGERRGVDRLLDWASSDKPRDNISDASIRLTGIVLCWFLSSSHRFLRDRVTKALVRLFQGRIALWREVLGRFLDVNDPYIVERVLAVSYGIAMRTKDLKPPELVSLSAQIHEQFFKQGKPLPHILARDYARGVAEATAACGLALPFELKDVRPPYTSEWPENLPPLEEFEWLGEWAKGQPRREWAARLHLHSSVGPHGDFARYVIGTNFGTFAWSGALHSEEHKPTAAERQKVFESSLTERQLLAWEAYLQARSSRAALSFSVPEDNDDLISLADSRIAQSESRLRGLLGARKLQSLDEVLSGLDAPETRDEEGDFDLSLAQRYVLNRVLELGWTIERFGEFDDRVADWSSYGRDAHKPERIGKKYQWIAYHEFLARVADHFRFAGEYGDRMKEGPRAYEGPWQISGLRDIDPSVLLRRAGAEPWEPSQPAWWFAVPYDDWQPGLPNKTWLRDKQLPNCERLLRIVSPDDESVWLTLEGFYRWERPRHPADDPHETPRRQLTLSIQGYLTQQQDHEALFRWATQQNFWGDWMPGGSEIYEGLLGEYPWGSSVDAQDREYFGHEGWTDHRGRLPSLVLNAVDSYSRSTSGFDCSVTGPMEIQVPTRWLCQRMGLRWLGDEGTYVDQSGVPIVRAPSVFEPGPNVLLIREEPFLHWLETESLGILWTVVGAKRVLGPITRLGRQGDLEISGAYALMPPGLTGTVNAQYVGGHE